MKVYELNTLQKQIDSWKESGEIVVFTNGVFDILHVGHVDYLQKAKALGTKLIVGINNDASVRKLNKGPERPIHPEQARAQVISALRCVDAAIIFSEETPLHLIQKLLPSILVKGGDYDPKETNEASKTFMVGSKEVRQAGGKVEVIPLVEGFSTTTAIDKIRSGNH